MSDEQATDGRMVVKTADGQVTDDYGHELRSRREDRAYHHLEMGLRYIDEALFEFNDSDGGTMTMRPSVVSEINRVLKVYGLLANKIPCKQIGDV